MVEFQHAFLADCAMVCSWRFISHARFADFLVVVIDHYSCFVVVRSVNRDYPWGSWVLGQCVCVVEQQVCEQIREYQYVHKLVRQKRKCFEEENVCL